eukprot:594228-Rhodomonas_salina.2
MMRGRGVCRGGPGDTTSLRSSAPGYQLGHPSTLFSTIGFQYQVLGTTGVKVARGPQKSRIADQRRYTTTGSAIPWLTPDPGTNVLPQYRYPSIASGSTLIVHDRGQTGSAEQNLPKGHSSSTYKLQF